MANILVVDDEIGIRELLSEILADEGHVVMTADSAASARAMRQAEPPDLVLLDIWMPDTDGVTLLKEWAAGGQLTMPVIMMSGHATIDTASEAARFGALDFLEKPIAMARLLSSVKHGLEHGRMAHSAQALRNSIATAPANDSNEAVDVRPQAAFGQAAAAGAAVSLDQPLREARDQFERVYFEYHLARENFSMTRVADRAGLERTHLYRKLKQLGVELARGGRRPERAIVPDRQPVSGHDRDSES
ncbi:MAG TPA: response regulator [Burkholderiaceae bacterium]|jgi:DNA-binding NtrC family response regulator|nr:response regulator [Burkholderiaceae bacterium]